MTALAEATPGGRIHPHDRTAAAALDEVSGSRYVMVVGGNMVTKPVPAIA